MSPSAPPRSPSERSSSHERRISSSSAVLGTASPSGTTSPGSARLHEPFEAADAPARAQSSRSDSLTPFRQVTTAVPGWPTRGDPDAARRARLTQRRRPRRAGRIRHWRRHAAPRPPRGYEARRRRPLWPTGSSSRPGRSRRRASPPSRPSCRHLQSSECRNARGPPRRAITPGTAAPGGPLRRDLLAARGTMRTRPTPRPAPHIAAAARIPELRVADHEFKPARWLPQTAVATRLQGRGGRLRVLPTGARLMSVGPARATLHP